ncbi:MAG: hypothetical protein L0Y36_01605 [Planctomycetales bacterium]|nr:hypothetical protein [Planctomycetales bacterium]
MFRLFFQDNPFREAAKGMARGAFVTGLFLIGFGMLVFILRDLFAFLAAAIFFMAGFSAIGYAVRLFILQHKMKNTDDAYRKNVQIHYDDDDY